MRTVKKLCSLLLSILLLAAAVPLPAASAQEAPMSGACGPGLTWSLSLNGDGIYVDNETGAPVQDPAAVDPENTHFEAFYDLTVTGNGAIDDFIYL